MNTGYPKRDVEKPKRRKPDPPMPNPPSALSITVKRGGGGIGVDNLWYAHLEGTPINMTAAGKTIPEAVDRMFELIIERGVEAAMKS